MRYFAFTIFLVLLVPTTSFSLSMKIPLSSLERPRLVWLTGYSDLRVRDHGGFTGAIASIDSSSSESSLVVPIFIFDPKVHLKQSKFRLKALLIALKSLQMELKNKYNIPLVIRTGDPCDILVQISQQINATSIHIREDDIEEEARTMQRVVCQNLKNNVNALKIERWKDGLRMNACFMKESSSMPDTWKEYSNICEDLELEQPLKAPEKTKMISFVEEIESETIPDIDVFSFTEKERTDPPYKDVTFSLCDNVQLREALQFYVEKGRDDFANRYFSNAIHDPTKMPSLYTASAQRLLDGSPFAAEVLSLREAPARAFSMGLALGVISLREVYFAIEASKKRRPDDVTLFGRSSKDALLDVLEWKEFYHRLAQRTLDLKERKQPWQTGGNRVTTGDERDRSGTVEFWRWGGHIVRYIRWSDNNQNNLDNPKQSPLLLVHGFAASLEQWERFVFALKKKYADEGNEDKLPTIYALDLLGFGHSEKPGLSYTQYLWEAQIVDFVREKIKQPVVLVGNSIGGGLSAGAASTLFKNCRGVVLCNTAGLVLSPGDYIEPSSLSDTVGERTCRREYKFKPLLPIEKLSRVILDLFGYAILGTVGKSIPQRLKSIYAGNPENADDALSFAIEQSAAFPGSPNVIGSGYKLAPNRPLNEVLGKKFGFGGPILVVQGLNDNFSGKARAVERANELENMRDGVTVKRLQTGGHCVMDDSPKETATSVYEWLPQVQEYHP